MPLDTNQILQLERIIRDYMRRGKVPGLAISILEKGEVIYNKGFGARDLKAGLPMTPKTLMGIGSVNKSITALGVMKLVEQGKLSLEDPVSNYISHRLFLERPEIHVKHLLSHSTGIPASDASLFEMFYLFGDYTKVAPVQTREQFLDHIADAAEFIQFQPEQKFFYNNDMYCVAGFIIEDLTGLPYADFIAQEVLGPLGITRFAYTRDQLERDPDKNIMTGYLPKAEDGKSVPNATPVAIFDSLQAPGGLYISTEDMMRYARCLLSGGQFEGKQIISPDSLSMLWKPVLGAPYGFGGQPSYSLGWVIDEGALPGIQLIHHGGGLGTSCAFFMLIPALDAAVMVAQNSCTANTSLIGRVAGALLAGVDLETHVPDYRLQKLIKEVCGEYQAPHELYRLKLAFEGGVIHADIEIDDGPMKVPVFLVSESPVRLQLALSGGIRPMYIEFLRNKATGAIEFAAFDRYLYKKISFSL